MKTYLLFLSENFQFLVVKFSVYLNRHVFIMDIKLLFFSSAQQVWISYQKMTYLNWPLTIHRMIWTITNSMSGLQGKPTVFIASRTEEHACYVLQL